HIQNENLAVSDLPGTRAAEDGIDGHRHEGLGDPDLQAHLLLQIDLDGSAAVGLDVLGLAAVPQNAGYGEPTDFGSVQRLQNVVETVGADDRYDEFHGVRPPLPRCDLWSKRGQRLGY